MSKGREAQAVCCPHFVRYASHGIVCRGFVCDSVLEWRFGDENERRLHIQRFCNSAKYCSLCPIAKIHNEHFDRINKPCDTVFVSREIGAKCSIAVDGDIAMPFINAETATLILPCVIIYDKLRVVSSDGQFAYPVEFVCGKTRFVIYCTVCRGYVEPENGTVGVEYWILRRLDSYAEKRYL